MGNGGRPKVFGKDKRDLLCGLVASGFTRRQATEHVGVSGRTVARALGEDEEFRRMLSNSELRLELHPIQHIRSQMSKQWRAAAWVLERQRPDLYVRRAPRTVTLGDLRGIFGAFLQLLLDGVPEQPIRDRVRKNVETFLAQLGGPQRCSPQVRRVLDNLNLPGEALGGEADEPQAPSASRPEAPAREPSSVITDAPTTRHNLPQADISGQNST